MRIPKTAMACLVASLCLTNTASANGDTSVGVLVNDDEHDNTTNYGCVSLETSGLTDIRRKKKW